MKKTILVLFVIIISFSFKVEAQNESTLKYFHFKGKIDNKYPITMDLYVRGDAMSGKYYYDKVGQSISVSGVLNDDNTFELKEGLFIEATENEGSYHKKTGLFKGKFEHDNSLSGTWMNPDETTKLSFELKENYLHSARFRYYEYNNKFHLKDDENNPEISFELQYAVPITAPIRAGFTVLLKNYKKMMFGDEECGNIDDCIMSFVVKNVNTYNEEEEFMSWDISMSNTVFFNDKNLLIIANHSYEFMGGAHGMPFSTYCIYDLHSGNQWQKDDILIKGKEEKINNLIKQKLIDDGVEEDLFDIDEVFVTDNIGVDGSKIYFYYNVYDITPYVYGPIELAFSYKEFDEFLTGKFKERMGLDK
jgi:Protein of unknown function (DUF3298)